MKKGDKWNGWTVEDFIGEGSYGTVYKIVRNEFGHPYESALKIISIPKSSSEIATVRNEGMDNDSITTYFKGMVEDMMSELAIMSEFRGNSNIVSYEDHSYEKKNDSFGWNIFIRMEMLTPLFTYMKDHPFSVQDVVQLGIDMCTALDICQKYNIIHRDVKPENIFVSKFGTFKLGDFGIARQLENATASMSIKGTESYMAPEVYKGESYNSNVDTYSLGIVLYRFLNNNRLPFLPEYPNEIRYSDRKKAKNRRMSGEAIPAPCFAEGRLAEIVLKACAYDPKDRYDSPLEMKEDLMSVLDSEKEDKILYKGEAVKSDKPILTESNETEPWDGADDKSDQTEPWDGAGDTDDQTEPWDSADDKSDQTEPWDGPGDIADQEEPLTDPEPDKELSAKSEDDPAVGICAGQITEVEDDPGSAEKSESSKQKHEVTESEEPEPESESAEQKPESAEQKPESAEQKPEPAEQKPEPAEQKPESAEQKSEPAGQEPVPSNSDSEAESTEGKPTPTKKRLGKKEALAIVAAALIVICGIGVFRYYHHAVPDVVGMDAKGAEASINEAGLTCSSTKEFSEAVERGQVISQTDQGKSVKKGSEIRLTISAGVPVAAPDFTTLTEEEAKAAAENAGLVIVVDGEELTDSIPKGGVSTQSPEAGAEVELGSEIKLVMSKGIIQVEVPDVKGKTADDAKKELKKAGLKMGNLAYEYSSTEAGLVIAQSVDKGKEVDKHSAIDLVISSGAAPVQKSYSSGSSGGSSSKGSGSSKKKSSKKKSKKEAEWS